MVSTLFAIGTIVGFGIAPTVFFLGLMKGISYLRDDQLISTISDESDPTITWQKVLSEFHTAESYTEFIVGDSSSDSDTEENWKYP